MRLPDSFLEFLKRAAVVAVYALAVVGLIAVVLLILLSGPKAMAAGVGARPKAWCGWYMRTQYGGGPEYNLARNWSRRGYPAAPHVGAVVVWRHHVGFISGRSAKGWIVTSGNDGGKVRSRVRSIKGAAIRGGV